MGTSTANEPIILHVDEPGALYCYSADELGGFHTPAFIRVDLRDTEAIIDAYAQSPAPSADCGPEVFFGFVVPFDIDPALAPADINAIMDAIAADAQIACDGTYSEWDGDNYVARRDEAAEEALERIEATINARSSAATPLTVYVVDDDALQDGPGIPAVWDRVCGDSTDDELEDLTAEAADVEWEAASGDPYGIVVYGHLSDIHPLLERLRDQGGAA